ncbi:MAG: protein phosphatase 2C domain-containing protein [Patescibacteria group bacterium]|jgi:hypothetical protein
MINVDEYYSIGTRHQAEGKSCQDHAVAYLDDELACVGISDGCSKGRHTDVGARIVNYATVKALREYVSFTDGEIQINQLIECVKKSRTDSIEKTQKELELQNDDLFATSLYACISPELAFAHMVGDGALAIVDREGRVDARRFYWAKNMPYYPSYEKRQKAQYIFDQGGDLSAECFFEERWRIDPSGLASCVDLIAYSLGQAMGGVTIDLSVQKKNATLAFVSVFSDGIEQVDGMSFAEAIFKCVAYKNTKGAFVKRRMLRFVKDIIKERKSPFDDLSCAAIYISKEREEGGACYDENCQEN